MALRGGGLIIEAWPRTVKTAEASKAARKGARGATAGGMSKVALPAWVRRWARATRVERANSVRGGAYTIREKKVFLRLCSSASARLAPFRPPRPLAPQSPPLL